MRLPAMASPVLSGLEGRKVASCRWVSCCVFSAHIAIPQCGQKSALSDIICPQPIHFTRAIVSKTQPISAYYTGQPQEGQVLASGASVEPQSGQVFTAGCGAWTTGALDWAVCCTICCDDEDCCWSWSLMIFSVSSIDWILVNTRYANPAMAAMSKN